jgi:hypothetical protein
VGDSDINEVWGLFDHDGRSNIDQVCARAKRLGVKVALSHPAFELWLLLHFQDFSPAKQDGSNAVVMEKLRNAHPAFAEYRDGNKRINLERFEALNDDDRIRMAVARARRLSNSFTYETPSNRDPSTDVYLLIESLGIASAPPLSQIAKFKIGASALTCDRPISARLASVPPYRVRRSPRYGHGGVAIRRSR